jgi:glc operon protein GlcG
VNVTLERARQLIDTVIAAAGERGLRVAVVVLDAGGQLVAAQRMDGAYLTAINIAERKAFTAANFRVSTVAMRERLATVEYQLQLQVTDSRLAFLPGGEPITASAQDATVIGGLGVSGGTGAQDIELCELALAF